MLELSVLHLHFPIFLFCSAKVATHAPCCVAPAVQPTDLCQTQISTFSASLQIGQNKAFLQSSQGSNCSYSGGLWPSPRCLLGSCLHRKLWLIWGLSVVGVCLTCIGSSIGIASYFFRIEGLLRLKFGENCRV